VIPAIANAIYHAVGVRIDEVPITPDMVLRGLALKRQGKPARIGPDKLPLFRFKNRSSSNRPSARWPTPSRSGRSRINIMMRLPSFDYVVPKSVDEAVRALRDAGPGGMLVAGGTDLYRT